MEKITGTVEKDGFVTGLRTAQALHTILVSAMMAALAAGIVHLGSRLAPGWRGGYLVWLAVLTALLALVGYVRTGDLEPRQRWAFHVSEWVVIAIILKLVQMFSRQQGSLWETLQGWQSDFSSSFFTAEYVLGLTLLAAVWWISRSYAADFSALLDREQDADWDEMGKLQNALHGYRSQITGRIFLVGIVVVGAAVIARLEITNLPGIGAFPPPSATIPVANVLVYFVLGLLLLSQTQFTLLRARWRAQHARVQPGLAADWLKYSAIFFLIVAAVIFFLPTEYSIGLFELLGYATELLMRLIAILLVVIMLPFSFCLSLFRFQVAQEQAQQPPPEIVPPVPATPAAPLDWLETLRMIAFWGVFLAILFFSIRYYLLQNQASLRRLQTIPVLSGLARFFSAIWHWLRGANRQIIQVIRQGFDRLQVSRESQPGRASRLFPRRQPNTPREHVLKAYREFLELGEQHGFRRQPPETPLQYQRQVSQEIPEVDNDVSDLTEAFLEARYSQHTVESTGAEKARTAWERIQKWLREQQSPPR